MKAAPQINNNCLMVLLDYLVSSFASRILRSDLSLLYLAAMVFTLGFLLRGIAWSFP